MSATILARTSTTGSEFASYYYVQIYSEPVHSRIEMIQAILWSSRAEYEQ
ncbi:hypothetical protein [Paenibacillus foliorum]|nr:hypothetical protein [Paenibacillus foliorum]